MQHITAIGFDLFDTLITMRNLGFQEALDRLVHCLRDQGFSVKGDTFLPVYREIARGFMEEARREGKETHNRFWIGRALQTLGHHTRPDDARIANAIDAYFSAFIDHATLLPETLDMLDALKHRYRLGLLSNFTHPPVVTQILARLGLDAFLDVRLISGELGYRKPHHKVFQELSQQLGVPRERIAFVGDDLHADIHGAQHAGLQPIWTTYARQYKATLTTDPVVRPGDNPDPPIWAHTAQSPQTTAAVDTDDAVPAVPTIASWDELLGLFGKV